MPLLPIPERHFRLGNEAWAVDDCSYNNAVNKLLERERDYLSESVSHQDQSGWNNFRCAFPWK